MKKLIFVLTFILIGYFPCYSLAQNERQIARVAAQAAQLTAPTAPATQTAQTAPGTAPQPTAIKTLPKRMDMSKQAFSGVISKQLPMTSEQISALRRAFETSRRAAAAPAGIPARPATSSISVNLSPNAVPPVIRLGGGYISSLVFVDSTGQPWPITAYSVGDPNSFNIQWNKTSNTLLVQATSFYKRSNLAIILDGLDTPVMLTLLSGQETIDYRVDLRIPGMGPNATLARGYLPSPSDPVLLDVLNGVPYPCQAWLLNNKLYLRTPLVVISPAWQSIMTSIDGTHAYELQPASVILALQHGKDKEIKLILEGLK
jgi:intracellular multiplication protein IcmK